MYAAYKNNEKLAMLLVYVREAHPAKEAPAADGDGLKRPADITQPKTTDERVLAASACVQGLKLTLPVLIDTMDGVVMRAYKGWPAATAIVDPDGNVVFYRRGPNGVQPKEAEKVLRKLVGDPKPSDEKTGKEDEVTPSLQEQQGEPAQPGKSTSQQPASETRPETPAPSEPENGDGTAPKAGDAR